MHIDILLATYNGERYLKEQLNSILTQSCENWHLLIHDDNSTDDTINIIRMYEKKYPDKIKFIDDTISFNSASANFSFLLEQTNADYIMFCDQDDVWLPNKIEKTLSEIKKLENIYNSSTPLMVFSDLHIVDQNLITLHKSMWKSQKLDPNIIFDLYSILALNVVTGCTMMINNKAKQIVSPIPKVDILHDHWIAVNIAKYGYASYINETLTMYRQHGANVIGSTSSGIYYFFSKTKNLVLNVELFQNKYSPFNFHINLWKVILKKIILNSKRLF